MSVSLVTGLPRHGKSYYGVLQVIEELRRSKRYVVTNLPLDLKELGAFCDEWIGEVPLSKRLRILNTNETAEFWLHDPEGDIAKGVTLFKTEDKDWKRAGPVKPHKESVVPDFSARQRDDYPGVLYVIDEAHLFFDSYHWAELGDDMSYFVSQHGHLRTDIILITQHPSKLAKRLKVDLEEFTVVTNLGKQKLAMGVTVPGWFRRQTYPGKPDDTPLPVPETGHFRLKVETIGKLYSTSAGVGLAGRVDTQEQKRGKHWSKLLVVALAIIIGGIFIPVLCLKAMGKLINASIGGYLGETTKIAPKIVEAVMEKPTNQVVSVATNGPSVRNPDRLYQSRDMPRVFGFGGSEQMGWVLETEYGLVHGKRLKEMGDKIMMDGRLYSRRKVGSGKVWSRPEVGEVAQEEMVVAGAMPMVDAVQQRREKNLQKTFKE